jgi:CheY-like chemotaxis protein
VSGSRSFGKRILVAEDGYLLAEMICDLLRDLGMEPIGPTSRLAEACRVAREFTLDGAVLDVKMGDELCFPAASLLKLRGIPYMFLTGCSTSQIPLEFRGAPLVQKPFTIEELAAVLAPPPASSTLVVSTSRLSIFSGFRRRSGPIVNPATGAMSGETED